MSERWTKEEEEKFLKEMLKKQLEEEKREREESAERLKLLSGCLTPLIVFGLILLVGVILSLFS